jgi:Sec-independent protein translocase protein TatA
VRLRLAGRDAARYNAGAMSIIIIFVVVTVVLILLLNTKRWKGLARGARGAKRELEEEIKTPED